ncbi:MAG TPA: S9 family peptidase [Thermoanaerobaculia bacterium]|jgi:dipeptidyl aminopeptidase/acylaminoacyl peptidase
MKHFVLVLAVAVSMQAELPKLIPRELLLGMPPKALAKLAPDGKRLAYVANDSNGVPNVWVQPAMGGEATLITHERRPVWDYNWSGDGSQILFTQDDGDENAHVFAADLATGNIRDLTPFRGVRTQNVHVDADHPDELLVEMNLRDRKLFDVHRVNLESGAVTLEAKNPGDVNSWTTDKDFVIRAATAFVPDGRAIVRVRDSATAPWRDLVVMPFEKTPIMGQLAGASLIAGFAPDGKSLYIASALHSDTARIERIDAKSGALLEVVAEHPKSDAGDTKPEVLFAPGGGPIQAVGFHYLTPEWRFLDPKMKEDMERIAKETGRFIWITSRSADDQRWVVEAESPSAPTATYSYDRATKKLTLLFDEGEPLRGYTLAEVKPIVIKARDGFEMVSYLTIPPGTSGKNLPLVLNIHGGPWARDFHMYNWEVQFLANRGYAVLQVNHRGSTGLGLAYYNAGNNQAGRGMVDDLFDAVQWAVKEGIADPKRLVAYGGSMGGYHTLRAVSRQPETFSCAVNLVGIAELRTAIDAFPPFWVAARERWRRRIGPVMTDDALNRELSPLYAVDRIKTPMLVAAGAHDVRARLEHIDRFVKAMRDAKRDVTYVVYPDEGHGFSRPENNIDFYGRVEDFLARCAGGRAEPWKKVEGATAELR